MVTKLMAQIFPTMIRSHEFNCLANMILHFILELFELFKGFCLVPHQTGIAISTQVIGKGNKVLKSTSHG
jgi:hypothetical protein